MKAFNKLQITLTVIYFGCLVIIFLYLTPYYRYYNTISFGNFFIIERPIAYTKFFIEVGVLSVIYYLTLNIFKK